MIGHAKINKKVLKQWAENEKENIINAEDKKAACWYDSLWGPYFYDRQNVFKDAKPLIEICRSSFSDSLDDCSQEFMALIDNLENEGQRLTAFYADDTAVIVGYQDHKYILPAFLVEVDSLKDYSTLTAGDISALGDKEMSDAMLPADMSSSSMKSLEDELNDKKRQIESAEEECKIAIEKIREEARRKEQELRELLEKETENLRTMKKELENKIYILDTQIYGIRCYLGEVVDFTRIRDGKHASKDTPVVMFQKIRYLDEEMGKYFSLYAFGTYDNDKDTLIGALKNRDDLRDIFCPADRCITVLRMSRTGKLTKTSDYANNMLQKYEYLHGKQIAILVRDGEALYIGWTDEDRIKIYSEDMFLRPGETTISEVNDTDDNSFWSKERALKYEKEKEERDRSERISRYFLISIIQGMIDNGELINIPAKTKITQESNLVKFSFAEGWLKDTTYGTFEDILDKSKDITIKKGEMILTGMHVTRDDAGSYSGSTQYATYSNDRGIGERNRTHDASIPAFQFLPINKTLREAEVYVTFDLYKAKPVENSNYYFTSDHAKSYDVVKDPDNILMGTYTCKRKLTPEDFNKVSENADYKKVVTAMAEGMLWYFDEKQDPDSFFTLQGLKVNHTRYNWLPDLNKFGVPEIVDVKVISEEQHTYISVKADTYMSTETRVNFEIIPGEYVRTTYLCSTWLKYVITTGNIGDFRIGGTKMSYAEALKYLNNLIGHVKKREETEKTLLLEAGGKEYIESHSDWDRELCEWRIANRVTNLTARSAKKFVKEHQLV